MSKPIGQRSGGAGYKRAAKGKLDIIDSNCPHCGHHKAVVTPNMGRKCTKCKQRY